MLADIVKIHCLKHHADFPMPRSSRIVVCKEGADEHTLSDNFPYSGSWIYCCNCQSFISWEIGRGDLSVKQCPFCLSSLNPRLYLCDHCAVTMLDFDDQTLRKHYTVLSWGMPQPSCPACHKFPGATPKQHFCHRLGVNLATARPSCLFCNALTDDPPDADKTGPVTAKIDMALAEAEARAREAEERIRLAEEAARKEIELRRQAERKAEEIEKKAARELAQTLADDSELARTQVRVATAKAEAEARARAEAEKRAFAEAIERQEAEWGKAEAEARALEAEERAREIEALRIQAEATAIKEAERREMAELRARQMSERSNDLSDGEVEKIYPEFKPVTRRHQMAIAIYAGSAVVLFLVLILIIWAIVSSI